MEAISMLAGLACHTLGLLYYAIQLYRLWRNRQKA